MCLARQFVAAAFLSVCLREAHAQAIDDALPGTDSPYTARLARLASRWPAGRPEGEIASPVDLTCLATTDADSYVGTLRRALVQAPVEAVAAVLDDIAHYRELMPGATDIHVIPGSIDGHRFATSWEQRVPVFFLPNVRYELSHLVDRSRPGRVVYRYKLRRSDVLRASDGLVVLEALNAGLTRFTEYGFFETRPSAVPSSVIWRQSVRGAFRSATAIKLRAENPAWSYRDIARESERLEEAASALVEDCLATRHRHRLPEP